MKTSVKCSTRSELSKDLLLIVCNTQADMQLMFICFTSHEDVENVCVCLFVCVLVLVYRVPIYSFY